MRAMACACTYYFLVIKESPSSWQVAGHSGTPETNKLASLDVLSEVAGGGKVIFKWHPPAWS
jgi:hypothetical protein